jgi:hypothetical protein
MVEKVILIFEVKEDFIYEKPNGNEDYKKGETIEMSYNIFKIMVNDNFLTNFKIKDIKINENYDENEFRFII